MSRNSLQIGENIIVVYGNDHAIGTFIDIIDLRFEGHQDDHQGEGFVAEWSELFGLDQGDNKIGINVAEIKLLHTDLEAFKQIVIYKCDKFAATLAPKQERAKYCVHCGEYKDPSTHSSCDMGYHQDCNFYNSDPTNAALGIPEYDNPLQDIAPGKIIDPVEGYAAEEDNPEPDWDNWNKSREDDVEPF